MLESQIKQQSKQTIAAVKSINIKQAKRAFQPAVGLHQLSEMHQVRLNQRSSLKLNTDLNQLKPAVNFTFRGNKKHTPHAAENLDSHKANASATDTYYLRATRQAGNTDYRLSAVGIPEQPINRAQKVRKSKNAPKSGFAQQVLQLINVQRRNSGLQPLKNNPKLTAAAKNHSWDMAANDFISHTGSNNSTPFDRIAATGYKYSLAAENVAAGQPTPEAVVRAWMNSPGHRANILHPKLREIGIGYFFLSEDTGNMNFQHYWTQDFGSPMV